MVITGSTSVAVQAQTFLMLSSSALIFSASTATFKTADNTSLSASTLNLSASNITFHGSTFHSGLSTFSSGVFISGTVRTLPNAGGSNAYLQMEENHFRAQNAAAISMYIIGSGSSASNNENVSVQIGSLLATHNSITTHTSSYTGSLPISVGAHRFTNTSNNGYRIGYLDQGANGTYPSKASTVWVQLTPNGTGYVTIGHASGNLVAARSINTPTGADLVGTAGQSFYGSFQYFPNGAVGSWYLMYYYFR
jgi:hypothetical protein